MSQENVEVVKRGFEHLVATGKPLWASIAADVEVHDHHSPDQDVYETARSALTSTAPLPRPSKP